VIDYIYQQLLIIRTISRRVLLSTIVDKTAAVPARRPRSSAAATRARVLDVARIAFCHVGFDHVGVREIAARAGTDAAIVIRLFGSKEALFREVANGAFDLEPAFKGAREQMGEAVAALLLGPAKALPEPDAFDAFRFLLRSSSSPLAAPIVSASLHACFVAPLAAHLGGRQAAGRAALVTACVLGFTTMRFALNAPAFGDGEALRQPFAAAIQACLDA
jgi:AcrR family transcriptional regulator